MKPFSSSHCLNRTCRSRGIVVTAQLYGQLEGIHERLKALAKEFLPVALGFYYLKEGAPSRTGLCSSLVRAFLGWFFSSTTIVACYSLFTAKVFPLNFSFGSSYLQPSIWLHSPSWVFTGSLLSLNLSGSSRLVVIS